jgi:hypothetical protein
LAETNDFLNDFLVDSLKVDVWSGATIIKLFTAVSYHHSMVIPSICVIKLYYLGNYCGMAINYCGILTLEKLGLQLPW